MRCVPRTSGRVTHSMLRIYGYFFRLIHTCITESSFHLTWRSGRTRGYDHPTTSGPGYCTCATATVMCGWKAFRCTYSVHRRLYV